MTTYLELWKRRRELLKNKNWNGDDPRPMFDLSQLETIKHLGELTFTSNWKDLSLQDLREVFEDLVYGSYPERLINKDFDFRNEKLGHNYFTILSNKSITCIAKYAGEQKQITIHMEDEVYSVSWYKNRGAIDSFINCEYGQPITLGEMTDILEALQLETNIQTDE